MKLVVTGSTGFVGTEVIRQALRNPRVTSVVALARRPVEPPANAGPLSDASKLLSVVLEDWTAPYPPEVQSAVAGADACIWALAVTPSASKDMPFSDVSRVCFDYTSHAISNIVATASVPFRFVYVSGVTVERDQKKPLPILEDYRRMRGRLETALIAFAASRAPNVQVAIVKPGGIDGPGREEMVTALMRRLMEVGGYEREPRVHVSELAVAMIGIALNGVSDGRDTLWSPELADAGKRELRRDGDYLK